MGDTTPAALLTLREADVVRICGLDAAARAIDLVRAHRVTSSHRAGFRLTGSVEPLDGQPVTPWMEVPPDQPAGAIRWGCTCATGLAHATPFDGTPAGSGLACDHVAALLTQWIRHPTAFASPLEGSAATPRPRLPDARHRPVIPADALPAPASATHSNAPPSLAQQLASLPEAELAVIAASVLGAEAPMLATHDMRAEQVRAALCERTRLSRMLSQLDQVPARLVRDVALLGGSLTRAELHGIAARAGLERTATTAAISSLQRHFLLVPVPTHPRHPSSEAHTSRRAPDGWRIPAEVLAAMQRDLMPTPAAASGLAPTIQAAPLGQFCAALALLVHAPGPMHPCATGTAGGDAPNRRPEASARELPTEPGDPPRAALAGWARLAQVPAGMARLARQVLRTMHEREGNATALFALDHLPMAEWPVALRSGFRAWLDAPSYADLSELSQDRHGIRVRCDRTQLSFQPNALAAENAAARRFLVGLLAHAVVGRWLALDAFLELVWRLDPLFLRRRQRAFDTPAWWLEDARSGQPLRPDVRDDWLRSEARYCWALLSGPLHWFGALDLATHPDGARRSVRVTPLGAYLLGASDDSPNLAPMFANAWGAAALPVGKGTIAVHPLAAGGSLLDALTSWARVTGVSAGRLTLRLSTDLACGSLDAARDPDTALSLLRALDQRDGTNAAAALEPVLATWRASYGHARITHPSVVLEAREAATLAEALAAAPALAQRCRLLTPDVALVPPEDAPELARALARRGFVT